MICKMRLLTFFIFTIFISPSVFAGSPWMIDSNGTGIPYTWPDGQVAWYLEKGNLGAFDNEQIKALIEDALASWEGANIKVVSTGPLTRFFTSNINAQYGVGFGQASLNDIIMRGEFPELLQKVRGVVIVFDPKGEFIASTGEDPKSVVALTFPGKLDEKNLNILSMGMLLNGAYLADADSSDAKDERRLAFLATITHEFGHVLNLDHSGLNDILREEIDKDIRDNVEGLPTMNPHIATDAQITLHYDDVVAASNLYPKADFVDKFCEIAGHVLGADGLGYQGVQIVVRDVQGPIKEAISAITGNSFPKGTADGSYIIRGIKPGATYQVSYEEINPNFTGASSIQPYGADDGEVPRGGFGSGKITAGNASTETVSCVYPDEIIIMDTLKLNVSAGGTPPSHPFFPVPAAFITADKDGNVKVTTDEKKSGCSLIPY